MADTEQRPKANSPHSVHVLNEEYRKTYVGEVIDKFFDEFIFHLEEEVFDEVSDEEIAMEEGTVGQQRFS